ncbi:hypothetical protein V8G54_015068 [Vigna mungo]|uniref:PHD finger protein ALFIN-LIKE n=1 Tax=Vigna mungo TaxID=3915 RepID=A0AAQ3NLQ6_VIGMU
MQEKDWLSLVAVHSDSWLLAVAFYFGARFGFGKNESGKSRQSESQAKGMKMSAPPKEEDDSGEEEEEDDEQGATCGACGDNYGTDEFWICCDMCERWFHGKCVKITPAKAEHIKQYKCPSCSNKRVRV